MNKKGIESTTLMMYGSIIFVFISLMIGTVVLLTDQFRHSIVPKNLEPEVYESMLLYSPNCFAYKDKVSGRVYTGTIDLQKFTELKLRQCIPNNANSEQALKVELISAKTKKSLETINYASKATNVLTKKTRIVEIKDEGPGIMIFYHKE